MNAHLQKLIALQEIDRKLHDLDVSTRQFPEQVAALEAALAQARSAVDTIVNRKAQAGKDIDGMAQAIVDAKAAVERSNTRLSTITTNREYDAVHQEIATNQQLEVNARKNQTALQEDLKKYDAAIEQAQAQLKEVEEKHSPVIAELRVKLASIDGQRQELLNQRTAAVVGVSSQHLRVYDNIRKHRKTGIALSMVQPHDKICAVCHKVLEAQLVNDIRAAKRLNICASCGSILVWDEPTGQQ